MSQTIVPSPEKLVASGDGRLATQAFGDPSDPAVLLIKGQMASMLVVARTVLSTTGRSRPVRDPPRQPRHGAARPVMSPALLGSASSGLPVDVVDPVDLFGIGLDGGHV
jgi:hypothetical protein